MRTYPLVCGDEKTFTNGSQAPVVGDVDGTLTLWSTDQWGVVRPFTVGSDRMRYDVNVAVWAPNGRWFATAYQDGWVRVWDPGQDTAIASFQQQKGWFRGLAWENDNRTLAAGARTAPFPSGTSPQRLSE